MAPGIFHPDNKTFGYVPTTTTVTDTTAGYVWTYPDYDPAEPYRKDREYKEKQAKREEKNMRTLYRVIVVDPKSESVIEDKLVIATSAENAKLKAITGHIYSCDLDDLDIVVHALGQIRPKQEVQKVKVVSEE